MNVRREKGGEIEREGSLDGRNNSERLLSMPCENAM